MRGVRYVAAWPLGVSPVRKLILDLKESVDFTSWGNRSKQTHTFWNLGAKLFGKHIKNMSLLLPKVKEIKRQCMSKESFKA